MKLINPLSKTTGFTTWCATHPLVIVAVALAQIVNVCGLLIEVALKQHWLAFDLVTLAMSLVSAIFIALVVVDFA